MKTKAIAAAILSVLCLAAMSQSAQAIIHKKNRAKISTATALKSKAVTKTTTAKSAANGPRFVDGVAILNYDSGGSIPLSSGATHVQTFNKGTARGTATVARTAASGSSTRSESRSETGHSARPVPPQFVSEDMDGRSISLSQYRGRVVLLDFWATWCPPCREEAPQIVQTYKKYHGQGLEIVGVSLDHDASEVSSFTHANGMTWRQIFGGKDWDSSLAQMYGITSIPNNVLIGRDGTAIGINLHGDVLQSAIEYALAER